MRKKIALVLVCVFALAFAIGALVSTAHAAKPCFGTCLNGYWFICCPAPGGGYECFVGDECDWGPIF